MRSAACPACAGAAFRVLGRKDGFAWRRCRRCDSLSVDRAPTAEESRAAYGPQAVAASVPVPELVRVRLRHLVQSFARHRTHGRILDVGYGAGTLLGVAAELGWECWGVEVSPPLVAQGRRRGWRIHDGELADLNEDSHFDVVCLVEVLEHLDDPVQALGHARRLLRPSGLLYGSTPNGGSLNARLLGLRWSVVTAPEHLQLMTPQGLRTALKRAGLADPNVETRGLNPVELVRLRRPTTPGDRVRAGYTLNEMFSRGPQRWIRQMADTTLSTLGIGDSSRFTARRP